MKKRFWWVLAGLIILLIFSNPTQADFKSYAQLKTGLAFDKIVVTSRTSYWLIFSVYEYKNLENNSHEKFIGIFKNFITLPLIKRSLTQKEINSINMAIQDSISAADSMMRAAEMEAMEAWQADSMAASY